MNELKFPYIGCGKLIPCYADIKHYPHCNRKINIVALAKSQNTKPPKLGYIENPDKK